VAGCQCHDSCPVFRACCCLHPGSLSVESHVSHSSLSDASQAPSHSSMHSPPPPCHHHVNRHGCQNFDACSSHSHAQPWLCGNCKGYRSIPCLVTCLEVACCPTLSQLRSEQCGTVQSCVHPQYTRSHMHNSKDGIFGCRSSAWCAGITCQLKADCNSWKCTKHFICPKCIYACAHWVFYSALQEKQFSLKTCM
jgi:hypothetical protein